ncbi:MAG: TSUP family transporter [Gammaproteobacteria bacterium]|nr:TSUP family transporter [Gammaproteobacteria bacterium]
MSILIWPAALLIGVILGMFGAGGGMVTVPALIYLADMPVKDAIAMSLWVVAIVSATALILQRPWRDLQVRLLMTFGVSGVFGSVAGSIWSQWIPERFQIAMFAVLILLVTFWLTRIELSNRITVFRFIPASVTGFIIGVLTGILGVGGGFLLVPALIYLGIGHFPTAVAHSLVLIVVNALAGAVTHLGDTAFSLSMALSFSAVAALGSALGGMLLQRLPAAQLQRYFSILLVILGAFMAWRSLTPSP